KVSILGRIAPVTDLGALSPCDLIIEAIPEVMDLKKSVFKSLDTICPPETVFASNTSSFSITALGGATQRPSQVAGLHFFNPAPLMKLVEVVYGQKTTPDVIDQLMAFAKRLGKTPVKVKDTPGFIVNRVARPFYGEALKILGESHGLASSLSESQTIETIDTILKEAGGFRMGPFELMDLIGIDINFAVTQSVYDATFQEPRYRPHPIQKRMVEAGLLGKKSGEGFYQYDHC
ncbi:MAG: 3-hydroxybutyryl-CoA dehydrogenase, partial [Cyanobacteria bacterium]|nr:3-hydroxybutyryl-CoA dehydrogenase [Cyanobacteriota bacterium]